MLWYSLPRRITRIRGTLVAVPVPFDVLQFQVFSRLAAYQRSTEMEVRNRAVRIGSHDQLGPSQPAGTVDRGGQIRPAALVEDRFLQEANDLVHGTGFPPRR